LKPARAFDPAEVAARLGERLSVRPEVLLVLGSGLSGLADGVQDAVEVPFSELPGLPAPTVAGHAGRFLGGRLAGRRVLVQAGRFHLYEGHPPWVVCGPVRVAHLLGVRRLLLTNAAGGVDRRLDPGSLMLLEDHLSFGPTALLAAPCGDLDSRVRDMSAPYDAGLARTASAAAAELGIPLARGVYAGVLGPSYETPAEVRALARAGAQAVGMSTIPEVVVARSLGMSCLAISLITNYAAGVAAGPLSHDDVVQVGRAAGSRLGALLERTLALLPAEAR
jgi:purine-nucleoside phosphorylase